MGDAIGQAVTELNQTTPDQEVLKQSKERISYMRKELGEIESKIRELGGGDAVAEIWDVTQRHVQEIISNIVSVLVKDDSHEGIVKPLSRRSSKSASIKSVSSKISGAMSRQSSMSSAASLRLQLKLETSALLVKLEGQATEDAQQRQLESIESEEADRKAEEVARQVEFEVKRKESLRQIESTRLVTKLREQQAMLSVLEELEAPSHDPPVMP